MHHIPHLVWWHRQERRIVEYGSSFAALRAAGMAQSITDTIYNMNAEHLARDAVTVYEALEETGLVTAAVNITCYRGRTKHLPVLPWVTKAAYGPKRFFFYSLFESDPDRSAARRAEPSGRLHRRVRRSGRPLARDARRLRLSRVLPLRLRLCVACPWAGGSRGRRARSHRRCDRGAARRRRRCGRVPRSLRGDPALRPRPDDRESRRAARGAARVTRRQHRRHRVQPCRPGVSAAGRARRCCDARPRARCRAVCRDDAATRGRRSRRAPRRRGAALPACGRRLADDRRHVDPRLPGRASTAAGRRSRIRTPASCSSPPPRIGSSSTSAAAITPAAAATARSSKATRSCPCSRSASTRRSSASPTSPRPCSRTSPAHALADRRAMVDRQLRARGIEDERVLAAMGRVPTRAVRAGRAARTRLRRCRAADRRGANDLAAVHGCAHLRRAAAAAETRRCSTSARVRAIRRPCLPSSPPKCTRSSGFRSSPIAHARRSPRRAMPTASTCTTATAASACPPRRRSGASPSRPPRRRPPPALLEQLGPRGRLVIPIGPSNQQFLRVYVQTPEGAADFAAVPCRFVPLVTDR